MKSGNWVYMIYNEGVRILTLVGALEDEVDSKGKGKGWARILERWI
jgi:hypothetical protein